VCFHLRPSIDTESGLTSKVSQIGTSGPQRAEGSGKDYVSLSLAAREFGPRKLYSNLARAWTRRRNRLRRHLEPVETQLLRIARRPILVLGGSILAVIECALDKFLSLRTDCAQAILKPNSSRFRACWCDPRPRR